MNYVHNICSNGWSMGTIGTTVYKDSIHLQSSFMPLCYSFTRSESSVPYQAALSQIIMVIHLVAGIPTSSTLFYAAGDVYRIELNEDEMKAGLFAYERWSRGAMSTFLDTKRGDMNVEQEKINDNYL